MKEVHGNPVTGHGGRVAFYSHDSFGLGHLRRTLRLAGALAEARPAVQQLVITGSPRAQFFSGQNGVRLVQLPAITKNAEGRYTSRPPEIPLEDTVRRRKQKIRQAVLDFDPDLLVVDHVPTGLQGELLPLLGDLRLAGRTELALGLRDIIDEPNRVVKSWKMSGVPALLRNMYQHVWVYGAKEVFPLHRLYHLDPETTRRVRYLGYLGRDVIDREPAPHLSAGFPDSQRPHLLCLVGGGGDGGPLARAFLSLLTQERSRWNGTLLTGPFLPREIQHELAAGFSRISHGQIIRFTTGVERWIQGSDVVITMGGYNSLMECLSLAKRTLVAPRTFPRKEQWLRSRAFEIRGLVKTLLPSDLEPERLAAVVGASLQAAPPPSPATDLPWEGTRRFAQLVVEVLRERALARKEGSHDSRRVHRA